MSVSLKHRLEFLALQSLSRHANRLPAHKARESGRKFGSGIGRLWKSRYKIAIQNLSRAFPKKSAHELEIIANGVFETIGQTAFEVLRFLNPESKKLFDRIQVTGMEHVEAAASQGKGALLMSAHLGNWELLGALVQWKGFPVDLIVKPLRNPLSDALINDCRTANDVGLIKTRVGTAGIVRALRAKRLVAILADQNAGREGVQVEFFGHPVSTPKGPAALSLRYGAPIITGYLIHQNDGTHFAHIDAPIEFEPTGDTEQDVIALTQSYTRRIEDYIRATPDQWLWTHRRWGKRG